MTGNDARAERHAAEAEVEAIKAALVSGMLTGRDFDAKHSELTQARADVERLQLKEQAEAAAAERERGQADRERLDVLTVEAAGLRQQGAAMAAKISAAIDTLGEAFGEADALVAASRQLEREGDSIQHRLKLVNGGAPLVYAWHLPNQIALDLYALALNRLSGARISLNSPAAMSAQQAARK